jgi:hypothetical protein
VAQPAGARVSIGLAAKARKWSAVRRGPEDPTPIWPRIARRPGTWCLDLGYFTVSQRGLDVAKAREVPRWRESEVSRRWSARDWSTPEAMTQTPPTVTDALSARLLKQLGAAKR